MKQPILYQRIEAVCIFVASAYFYFHLGYAWYWFVIFLLAVDVFMVGYVTRDNRIGARVYNVGHSYSLPAILLVVGVMTKNDGLLGASLIWIAHIGLDRALGYGLKQDSGFRDTHLGKIGQK